jgi:hypothetical protein
MPNSPHTPLERLASQINQLQDGYEFLAKASSLKDMARLFVGLLQRNFAGINVSLFHMPSGEKRWQRLYGQNTEEFSQVEPQPDKKFTLRFLNDAKNKVCIVQPLAGDSFLGVLLAHGKDLVGFGDADRVSIQLFSHLFANAYQPLLQRRSEKELVFSLNHRVLQLNSLIDTGIEVSKLKQEGSLHQLALERAAVLTNASRGLLIVSSGGRETERYAFPTSNIPAEGISENHRIQTSFTYLDNSYAFELFEKESRSRFTHHWRTVTCSIKLSRSKGPIRKSQWLPRFSKGYCQNLSPRLKALISRVSISRRSPLGETIMIAFP